MSRINIAFLVLVLVCGVVEAADYGGGSGVEGDPYLISSSDHLEELADNPEDWDKHFKMRNNLIPFGRHNSIGVYVGPDSEDNIPFTGVFDGNGGGIFPVSTQLPENKNTGIFGYIGAGGVVKNLWVDGYTDLEGAEIVGGLAVLNEGAIEKCQLHVMRISVGKIVGGFVGINRGMISRCSIDLRRESYEAGEFEGGIAGINEGGTITNCYVQSSNISGQMSNSGGIAGKSSEGLISGCTSFFSTNGSIAAGGLIGSSINDTISNSFCQGGATGGQFAGGLVGYCVGSDITNCYCLGDVSGDGAVGGFIGYREEGVVSGCFWDMEDSGVGVGVGQGSDDGIFGKTSAEMSISETFLAAGWDFIGESDNGTEDKWIMSTGRFEGPVLSYFPVPMIGDGTAEDPYQILQAAQLYYFGSYDDRDKHYILMADIDMNDIVGFRGNSFSVWPFPDFDGFSGVFDGNGHTISNYLYVSDDGNDYEYDYVGLFGSVNEGVIKNLTLKNAIVDADDSFAVGGLVGYCRHATIENCHVEGAVVGGNSVGGLVGGSEESDIRNCSFNGSVTGDKHVGGLVGHTSYCNVLFSFADAAVSGGDYIGGLIGRGYADYCYTRGSVTGNSFVGGVIGGGGAANSYAACVVNGSDHVGGICGDGIFRDNCLVDIDVLGASEDVTIDGVGRTTAQMQQFGTYVDAGWDVNGEIVNGASDFWVMAGEGEYPVFWWQLDELSLPVFSGGSGVEDDPYLLKTVDDLNSIGCNPRLMDKHFLVAADIDLEGGTVHSIGCEHFPFEGWFVADSHRYSNRFVIRNIGDFNSAWNDVGLFGYIGKNGLVGLVELVGILVDRYMEDVPDFYEGLLCGVLSSYNAGEILGCRVEGELQSEAYGGGLVGKNEGVIHGCRFKGKVTGRGDLGGLVFDNEGTIANSYFEGLIDLDFIGSGLVVVNMGIIENCYAKGKVVSKDVVAKYGTASGLVHFNGGVIRNCYSACVVKGNDKSNGLVGWGNDEIYGCFWNKDIAETERGVGNYETDPAGVVSLSTAEMMTVSPYANAQWDIQSRQPMKRERLGFIWMNRFIWSICDGINYPRISWDLQYEDFQCPDGVGFEDFALLAEVWGVDRGDDDFPWDYEQIGGDNNWVIDVGDLIRFAENWLRD